MMQKAGVDWEVEQQKIVTESGLEINDKVALVRTSDNTLLDVTGKDWKPVQNQEAFTFFSEFVAAGDMEMHTAGSLKEGRNVWALAKVKESFDVFGEDRVDSYLLFSNPHQYGKAVDVRFTPIRVVCNNTLTFSLQSASKNSVKVGHRTAFDADTVKETLGLASEKFAKYKEMAQFLGSRKISAESLIQYYNDVFPTTSRKEEKTPVVVYDDLSKAAKMCYDALEVQPGAQFAAGTWWQAFNSVTYYTDHLQGRNSENRLHNQWFGYNQAKKVTAAEKAVAYATAA
jgi:phage/plasmid-like protein (TIGR03299 family)